MPTKKTTRGRKSPAKKAPAAKKTAPVRASRPTRNVTEARRSTAVEKLTAMAEKNEQSAEAARRDLHRMYAGMLKAFDSGLTYDEISEIVGLSKIRVSQVLAEQRAK